MDNTAMDIDNTDQPLPESPASPIVVDSSPVEQLLASDTEAMKEKLFPPNDDLEVQSETTFTWQIEDWKSLEPKVHSPAFELDNYTWRILLFPEGNRSDHVSMYLETSPIKHDEVNDEKINGDAAGDHPASQHPVLDEHLQETPVESAEPSSELEEEPDWAVCASFGLVMWNPNDPSILHYSIAHHRFHPDEADWGFTKFYEIRRLFARQPNKQVSMIMANKVNITAFVRVIKDPTGVLWHNFNKYNSKKETGYVGLKNQGATCYLNSLLQSLYFTKNFRQAVYHIPTNDDKEWDSVPAALQRVFYLLKTSEHPVGTLQLTRSFGWDSGDAFTQHDVQELLRVLMDNLEGKMKGTQVDGALNNIFVGHMKSYIKCVNVDFESSRLEDYWDIQLNVKGMKDIKASFEDYVQVETLDGENQYQATGYGLQDAKKGVVFQSFPPVLHLQLKRYDYDFVRDMMVKINDRYEFPTDIDLSPYLNDEADNSESWEYALHGVLVHSGDLNAGHYYGLLKPEKDGHWYKFDDDRVTRATMKEVLEENFGGEVVPSPDQRATLSPQAINRLNYKRHSSAYMLVYIRKSRLDEVLSSVDDDIPAHIPQRLHQEAVEEQIRRKEREQQHLYMQVLLVSLKQFRNYHRTDTALWEKKAGFEDQPDEAFPQVFKVEKTMNLRDFIKLAAASGIYEGEHNENNLRLWTMVTRMNATVRLDEPLRDLDATMESIKDKHTPRNDLRVYLEEAKYDPKSGDQLPWSGDPETEDSKIGRKLLIFLKYFDPLRQDLFGIETYAVASNEKVGELVKHINQIMGWKPDTHLRLLEEVKPDMVEEMKQKSTFAQSEIQDGDIICFERVLEQSEQDSIQSGGFKTAKEFYDFLCHRVLLTFRRRVDSEDQNPETVEEDFDLWMSKKDTYDDLTLKVGQKIGVDPTHLQFFTTGLNGYQRQAVKRNGSTMQQIVTAPYLNTYSNLILYDVLDIPLAELETKKVVKVIWLTDGLSQEHKFDILVPKTSFTRDVIAVLREKADIPAELAPRIKLWAVHNNRIHRMLTENYPVLSLVENVQVYGTIMPEEEYTLVHSDVPLSDQRLIYVSHFQREPSRTHGIPFSFVLKNNEKFADTKVRLQKALGAFDKQFEKIKFAAVRESGYSKVRYFDDDDIILTEVLGNDEFLGLDHVDKSARRGYGERAIFIKN